MFWVLVWLPPTLDTRAKDEEHRGKHSPQFFVLSAQEIYDVWKKELDEYNARRIERHLNPFVDGGHPNVTVKRVREGDFEGKWDKIISHLNGPAVPGPVQVTAAKAAEREAAKDAKPKPVTTLAYTTKTDKANSPAITKGQGRVIFDTITAHPGVTHATLCTLITPEHLKLHPPVTVDKCVASHLVKFRRFGVVETVQTPP